MAAPRRERRQDGSAETRRLILETAIELAGEGGLDSMSIQAIAARSGVTRGSIAFHYGTKDELVATVVHETFAWARTYVDERLAAVEQRTMRSLIEVLHDLMGEPEAQVFAPLVASAVGDDSPTRAPYAAHYDALRSRLSAYIAEAAPGLADRDALAVALLGASLGINLQQRLADGHLDRRRAFDAVAMLFEAAERAAPR